MTGQIALLSTPIRPRVRVWRVIHQQSLAWAEGQRGSEVKVKGVRARTKSKFCRPVSRGYNDRADCANTSHIRLCVHMWSIKYKQDAFPVGNERGEGEGQRQSPGTDTAHKDHTVFNAQIVRGHTHYTETRHKTRKHPRRHPSTVAFNTPHRHSNGGHTTTSSTHEPPQQHHSDQVDMSDCAPKTRLRM